MALVVTESKDINTVEENIKTFTWSIPSISTERKILICNGYVRNNYSGYITHPIIELFAIFYSNDIFSLNEIKTAVPEQSFVSEVLVVNTIKFYLEIFPKGFSIYNRNYMILLLRVPANGLPPNISRLVVTYSMSLKETNTTYNTTHDFKTYPHSIWSQHCLPFLKIKDLNKLTFILNIEKVNIFDCDNKLNPWTDIPLYTLPSTEFVWRVSDKNTVSKIKTASNVVCITSPIFEVYGLKWYLGLWPNGSRKERNGRVNLYLNLVSGLKLNNKIVSQFIFTFVEYAATEPCVHAFVTDSNSWGIITLDHWPLTKDIQNLNRFTFKISLVLIDVYQNDKIITNKYVNHYEKYPIINVIKNIPKRSFIWKISKKIFKQMKISKFSEFFESNQFEMYGLKFNIRCYPNGIERTQIGSVNTMICLKIIPKDCMVICMRYNLMVIENNIQKVGAAAFEKNNLTVSWDSGRLSTQEIKEWNTFTIQLNLELIDVVDGDKNVTNNFV
eukprot:234838_1